jgi:hypothetical protein
VGVLNKKSRSQALFEYLENKFPSCIFAKRGRTITLHDGSFHEGLSAISIELSDNRYATGLLREIAEVINSFNYHWVFKNSGVDFTPDDK